MVTLSSSAAAPAAELQQTADALLDSTKQIRGLLASIVASSSNDVTPHNDQRVLQVWHQLGLYKTLNRHLQLLGEQQKRQLHSEAKSNVDQIQLRLLGEQYEADYLQQQISTLQAYEPSTYHSVRKQMISVDEHAALQPQSTGQQDEHAAEVARLQHELQQRQQLQDQFAALQRQYTELQATLNESLQRQQQTEANVVKLYQSALNVFPTVANPSDTAMDSRVSQLPSPLYTLYNHAVMLRSVYQPQGFSVEIADAHKQASSATSVLADLVQQHPLALKVTQQLSAERQQLELTVSYLPALNVVAAQSHVQGQSAHAVYDDLLANLYSFSGLDDAGRTAAVHLTAITAAPVSQPVQEQLDKYMQQHGLQGYLWLQYLCGITNALPMTSTASHDLSVVRQSISISDVLQRVVQRYAVRTQLAIQLQALQHGQHMALPLVRAQRVAAGRSTLQSFTPVAGGLQYAATLHSPHQQTVHASVTIPTNYPLQLPQITVACASLPADALLAINDAMLAYKPSQPHLEQAEAAGESMTLVEQVLHLQQLIDQLDAATVSSAAALAGGRDRHLLGSAA